MESKVENINMARNNLGFKTGAFIMDILEYFKERT
jgi:hypothetical protein